MIKDETSEHEIYKNIQLLKIDTIIESLIMKFSTKNYAESLKKKVPLDPSFFLNNLL